MTKKKEIIPEERVKEEKAYHFGKYLKQKQYTNMEIAAVEAVIHDKAAKKTIEEWDKIFDKILTKRLR